MTRLRMVGKRPSSGGRGLNFMISVYVPNFKSVVHFVLVILVRVLVVLVVVVTGGI